MEKENIIIKEVVEIFLKKLCVDFDDVSIIDNEQENICISIKSTDSGLLIGSEGNNIKALNYLIKQIIWRNENENVRRSKFFIDVNDYQANNIEKIKSKTLETAEKVVVFKRDIELEPMSSFERMIAHSVLTDNPNVTTESSGEGVFRRVCIKYIDNSL